jgi:hypothetical protein
MSGGCDKSMVHPAVGGALGETRPTFDVRQREKAEE